MPEDPRSDEDDDRKDDTPKGDSEADKEEGEDQGSPLYKRPLFWIIALAVAAVLIIGGLLWWLHARQYESTDDAFVDAHIVRISPQVAGILVSVPAQDNRHVQPGQLLAVIEPSGPEAQRAQAVAEVAQAEAQVHQAEGQIIAARAQRAQAVANAIGPAADARRAAADYARYATVKRLDAAAAADTQVDQARAQAESARGQAAAARRQIDTATANVAVAGKQLEAARAQVKAAQARVAQTNVTLNDLRLAAPVPGQVVNRSVNVGSYVAPGQQLMAIVPDKIWVTANFKETQLRHMALGQHVDIRIDAFPDIDFEGHVDSIQRGAGQAFAILPPQNATGNYVKVVQRVPVRILFDRPDPHHYPIGPGMSVVPRIKVR
jgi:membrane fusion protein, multidrug efflux system